MSQPLRRASQPLRNVDESPTSPEALFISSLIEEGTFDPAKWRVDEEDLACFKSLWNFCCDFQSRSGRAPTMALIKAKFPDFTLISEVDPEWAASKLREASAARKLRVRMAAAMEALADDDLRGAYDALDGYMVPVGNTREPHSIFDHGFLEGGFEVTRVPVPWDALGRVTGGIGSGEYWLVGARPGQGKTTMGCTYAARAIREGFSCIYFSMEMPKAQIFLKVARVLANRDKGLMGMLNSHDILEQKKAIDVLRERTPGDFGCYDPGDIVCDPLTVADAIASCDLVMIDHTMLMKNRQGKSAISDWRIAAEISNKVKEELLRHDGRVLALQQVNRAGESASPTRTPKTSELSGTDVFAQDGDVIITMNRYSTSVMVHSTEKVRLSFQAKWYTEYFPAKGRFDQISRDRATQIAVEDEDRDQLRNR